MTPVHYLYMTPPSLYGVVVIMYMYVGVGGF